MRLKRSKNYRKLMQAYQLHFGFREPYQVLLDSSVLEDAARFSIDLVSRLEGVLQGKVKPMITQCCIRHLYNAVPKNDALIHEAKSYERRRCNHHELEQPLSSLECLSSVLGSTNKHRYVVSSDDIEVRSYFRQTPGVPLIYIYKSVMILEPMPTASLEVRDREEKSKFKAGLKGQRSASAGQKRKREDKDSGLEHERIPIEQAGAVAKPEAKKRAKGPKGPNPLSIKKAKQSKAAPSELHDKTSNIKTMEPNRPSSPAADTHGASTLDDGESGKRKRKRKHKPKGEGGTDDRTDQDTAMS
ncbi:Fcf1-domain-containing protein [Massariosphaeria phaeospora]|uniref:U three protein 23 n=1 Tax=Massariosphaeria phaeospora TaxID=100035 RepID=A0A7C8MR37_9PLEO|nr:Fcf1-domain-containing protein [Massariosphaeria phaeospora]